MSRIWCWICVERLLTPIAWMFLCDRSLVHLVALIPDGRALVLAKGCRLTNLGVFQSIIINSVFVPRVLLRLKSLEINRRSVLFHQIINYNGSLS